MEAATDSLQKSCAVLMLQYANGDAIDTTTTRRVFPFPMTSVRDFITAQLRRAGGWRSQSRIVLVHGALQSAATWDLVVPRLRSSGRLVFVTTLTGLEGDAAALYEWSDSTRTSVTSWSSCTKRNSTKSFLVAIAKLRRHDDHRRR
jgi:hypothetical protein